MRRGPVPATGGPSQWIGTGCEVISRLRTAHILRRTTVGGTVAKHLTRVLQSSCTPRNRLWLACESCDRGFAFFGPGEGHVEPAATRLLTTERLARYVRLGGSSEAGWDPYVWNAQIGSAYPLSWVEVGLCNASAQQMDQRRRRTDPAGEWLDPTTRGSTRGSSKGPSRAASTPVRESVNRTSTPKRSKTVL
jgi:hypothetical protein